MASALTDLDELILRCRDENAKSYISEAVASYRAGAYRSAIVASWIAVCFDVIEKLHELALSGDKEAELQVDLLGKIHRENDLARALNFERQLLVLARDKFELISHIEFIDLERLQADRNRCAHPSLNYEEQAYTPSAELARVHIHSAVSHLLQHPPAQGKYALERLLKEVDSEYFTTKTEDAKKFFIAGPLRKPRESLVRNFVLLLLKALIKGKAVLGGRLRKTAALHAVAELHPQLYEDTLAQKLTALLRTVEDGELFRVVSFLRRTPDTWRYIDNDVQQRLQNYVKALPKDWLDSVEFALCVEPLRPFAESRIRRATPTELKDSLFIDMPLQVADRYVDIYLSSASFDDANEWGKELAKHAGDFTPEQVQRILVGAASNDQVLHSFQLAHVIHVLRAQRKLPEPEFEELLRKNGLTDFVAE